VATLDVEFTFQTDRETWKGTLRTFSSVSDSVAFERHFGIPFTRAEDDDRRVEWLLFLMWRAWCRETKTEVAFDPFLDELEDWDLPKRAGRKGVKVVEGVDPPVPEAQPA
jgi:hypothetical protein